MGYASSHCGTDQFVSFISNPNLGSANLLINMRQCELVPAQLPIRMGRGKACSRYLIDQNIDDFMSTLLDSVCMRLGRLAGSNLNSIIQLSNAVEPGYKELQQGFITSLIYG